MISNKNRELYIKRLMAQGMLYDEADEFVRLVEHDAQTSDKEYYIKVDYVSGDSFQTYNTSEDINLPWHNLSIVEENIKRLESQVRIVCHTLDSYTPYRDKEKAIAEMVNSDWVVFYEDTDRWKSNGIKLDDGRIVNQYSIYLLDDDGKKFIISTIEWMGYFENSQEFSIEEVDKHERNR